MTGQVPDPNSLPEGHPLRKLGTQLGMVQEEGSQAAPAAQAAQPTPRTAPQQAQSSQPISDPMSRPHGLPSGGMLYGNHDGQVIITPLRGEQEEIMAGAGEGLAASPVLRHVISQCVDTRGILYEQLELSDWTSIALHVLSLTLGTDKIPMFPTCDHCNQQFNGTRSLADIPCRVLRRPTTPGEETTWPPTTTQDEDEEEKILREMGLLGEGHDAHQVYVAAGIDEPVEVELSNGQRIGWRYLRLNDLVLAEKFAEKSNSMQATTPGAALHGFIAARHISTIDGQRVGLLEAKRWYEKSPLTLMHELRESMGRLSFGYELSPMFRCPNGHGFRQRLPLNGAMFRRRSSPAFG